EHLSHLFRERIATVNDDEICFAQTRIVENRFQQIRMAAAESIKTSRAGNAVNVHSHSETSSFACQMKEKKILQSFVITCARLAPSLFSGKISASSKLTQRKRGATKPVPIATRFANIVSIFS